MAGASSDASRWGVSAENSSSNVGELTPRVGCSARLLQRQHWYPRRATQGRAAQHSEATEQSRDHATPPINDCRAATAERKKLLDRDA